MEYINLRLAEFMIGVPTEEERKELSDAGYIFVVKGKDLGGKPFEMWTR